MAILVKDRVKETTTTTGTGTVTLLGASAGFQSFSAIGNGNVTYYAIVGQSTTEWEVGIGTYTSSGTTLSRDTILASSNSGSAVNFSAGTKDVFVTYPASAGQLPYTFNNQTSAYTVVASDLGKVINCTTGTFTVSLTSAATLGSGFNCWVWNSGAGTITIDPASSETIDGSATVSLAANQTTQVVSNGSNWYTIGKAVTIPTALLGITNSASPYTTALGYQAGASVTGTGQYNTLVGYNAGTAITTGDANVAVGYNALASNIVSQGAVAVGQAALNAATGTLVGGTNYIDTVAVGNNSLLFQTTGYFNVGIGSASLQGIESGIRNVGIGALTGGLGADVNYGVFIGASAGTAFSTGSNNIVIGYTAAESSSSVSNEITLGNASITSFRIPGLSLTWTSSGLPVANGGTGQTTYTDGQLLIGNTAGGLTKSTLTAGSNITITNGNGAITIAAAGGGGAATILESKQTISSNYTLTAGYNGISVGPVTISSGVSVTIPSGAKWLVVNSSPGATPVSGGGGIMPAMIWG